VPLHRAPLTIVSLPAGDYFDVDFRIDQRPAGRTRGEVRRVRLEPRPAVSLA
jgi:hypothetical protein